MTVSKSPGRRRKEPYNICGRLIVSLAQHHPLEAIVSPTTTGQPLQLFKRAKEESFPRRRIAPLTLGLHYGECVSRVSNETRLSGVQTSCRMNHRSSSWASHCTGVLLTTHIVLDCTLNRKPSYYTNRPRCCLSSNNTLAPTYTITPGYRSTNQQLKHRYSVYFVATVISGRTFLRLMGELTSLHAERPELYLADPCQFYLRLTHS
jgi:hypothetical protein